MCLNLRYVAPSIRFHPSPGITIHLIRVELQTGYFNNKWLNYRKMPSGILCGSCDWYEIHMISLHMYCETNAMIWRYICSHSLYSMWVHFCGPFSQNHDVTRTTLPESHHFLHVRKIASGCCFSPHPEECHGCQSNQGSLEALGPLLPSCCQPASPPRWNPDLNWHTRLHSISSSAFRPFYSKVHDRSQAPVTG